MVQVDPLPGDKKPNKNGHDGQEYDYVIEGQLEVTIEEKVMVLNPGDSIYFDSRSRIVSAHSTMSLPSSFV